jgi:proteasome component ECM29
MTKLTFTQLQMKKGIVKFLDCGVFDEDNEIVPHFIVASADTRFSVATPALNELNKICTLVKD